MNVAELTATFNAIVDKGAGVDVPVLDELQSQGDVIIIPTRARMPEGATVVGRAGVAVIEGEATRNTHLLLVDGVSRWAPVSRGNEFDLGVLEVESGAAYLTHTDEHGFLGMAPGRYTIRRQRQQADLIRAVQD